MAISQPLRYLDKALNGLRDLNLVPEKTDEAPIIDLIEQISDLDQEKTLAIARTLDLCAGQLVLTQVGAHPIHQATGVGLYQPGGINANQQLAAAAQIQSETNRRRADSGQPLWRIGVKLDGDLASIPPLLQQQLTSRLLVHQRVKYQGLPLVRRDNPLWQQIGLL